MSATSLVFALLCAPDLSGAWEIQALGSDTAATVEHSGQTIVIHRVLWPEFNGEKYKLEHLYRGELSQGKLRGKLLVKEDELPRFEVLRAFEGRVVDGVLEVDGMRLTRKAPPKTQEVAALPSPPPREKVRKKRKAPNPSQPAKGEEEEKQDPPTTFAEEDEPASGADLYEKLLGGGGSASMLKVSNEIELPDLSAEHLERGDKLFAKAEYRAALEAYEKAKAAGATVRVLHALGKCQLELGDLEGAKKNLGRALRLDPHNEALRKDYERAR